VFADGAVTAAMSYAFGSMADRGRGNGNFDPLTASDAEVQAYLEASGFYDLDTALPFEDTSRWHTWTGMAAGEDAAMYWAQRHLETGNPLYAVPGGLASLWTPDTAIDTALTLGGGAVAGRTVGPLGRFLGPRGPAFGDTAFGASRQGILNQGYFRMGFGRHQGAQFRIGVGNWKRDIGRPIRVQQRPPNG